jgi:hypothetical protein
MDESATRRWKAGQRERARQESEHARRELDRMEGVDDRPDYPPLGVDLTPPEANCPGTHHPGMPHDWWGVCTGASGPAATPWWI